MTDTIIWWYGAACLTITSGIGFLWLLDSCLEWIINGFKFRQAFFAWYAAKLRASRDDEPAA